MADEAISATFLQMLFNQPPESNLQYRRVVSNARRVVSNQLRSNPHFWRLLSYCWDNFSMARWGILMFNLDLTCTGEGLIRPGPMFPNASSKVNVVHTWFFIDANIQIRGTFQIHWTCPKSHRKFSTDLWKKTILFTQDFALSGQIVQKRYEKTFKEYGETF